MFDGQKWEFVSIKKCNIIAYQHVSYLENDLVLMAQFFTTFSFCKYVYFKQQNISSIIMAKEKLFKKKKKCFPYTAIVLVPSLVTERDI